jgi:arylsulfatase A-like enzyme
MKRIAVTDAASAQDRPNVVIMLGDKVGYGDIGAYGAGEVRGMPTPRIDSIASQGLLFALGLVLASSGLAMALGSLRDGRP